MRRLERQAEAIKALYRDIDDVREQAELTILLGKHRIGRELENAPDAPPGRHPKSVTDGYQFPATIADQVGSKKRGIRLKQFAATPKQALEDAARALGASGKEATLSGVLKLLAGEASRERRELSRAAVPIPDGPESAHRRLPHRAGRRRLGFSAATRPCGGETKRWDYKNFGGGGHGAIRPSRLGGPLPPRHAKARLKQFRPTPRRDASPARPKTACPSP
jgi:hypothetical protein